MEQGNKICLDSFRCLCEIIAAFDIRVEEPLQNSPNRLIGYEHYADVFKGLIPLADYDEQGNFSYLDDFPEIFPNAFPTTQKTSAAVLFTGETGCGKHTADFTFMSVAYRFVENEIIEQMDNDMFVVLNASDMDEAMEYYQIKLSAYDAYSERQLGEELEALFEQINNKAFSQPEKLFYFSLGDITRILESKKLAPRFLGMVNNLIGNPSARCILTCIYDGKSSQLQELVKKPFYVLELEPPTEASREEYFSFLLGRYHNIHFALNAQELAELTDGFTFAMVKQLAGYLLMAAKAALKKKKLKMQSVRFESVPHSDIIELDENKIRAFADLLRQSRYAPVKAVVPDAYQSVYVQPYPAAFPAQNQEKKAAQGSSPSTQAAQSSDDENIKGKVQKVIDDIDTPTQLNNHMDKLVIPVGYSPKVLMDHQTFHSEVCETLSFTMDDFLSSCRKKGITNLSNLKAVTLSLGGHLLLHPWNDKLLNPSLSDDAYDYKEVIRESEILEDNLAHLGRDMQWLEQQLKKQSCSSVQEVFLGVCDEDNELMIFRKI